MERIEKTVFISYRRKDVSWALTVYQDLTHKGYDVFFDYTSIPSGDFEQIIISNIKARAHFVMILTPTAFDRCGESGDWFRREIETAIDENRNIIPLFFDGFNFGTKNVSEKLTGKLKNVDRYNGMNVHHDYFEAAMERLRTNFLNVSLKGVLHPVSDKVQEIVRENQIAANKAKALWQSTTEKKVIDGTPIVGTQKTENKDQSIRDWLHSLDEDVAVQSVDAPKNTDSIMPDWLRGLNGDFSVQSTEKPVTNKHNANDDVPDFLKQAGWSETRDEKTSTGLSKNKITLSNGMEFMRVPAGKFLMGISGNIEHAQHKVDIQYGFWMGRFPVTNVQYNQFTNKEFEKGKENHPVIHVSWDDAQGYIKQMNKGFAFQLPAGYVFCLPSEAEWEKAARGETGIIYPWGNEFDKNKCNSSEGKIKSTSPVGFYSPSGDSPYGCADMSGNVWEWVNSVYETYPYVASDGRESEKVSGWRVLRGGSFDDEAPKMRCDIRYRSSPHYWVGDYGFRLAIAPPRPK